MVRLVHISDIHVTVPALRWLREDWFNKRLPAWLNFRWLGRGRRFRNAEMVLTVLMNELRQRRPDHVIFSGDATALGFEEEVVFASKMLGLHESEAIPGLAVPGNHDYCTCRSATGVFERHFAPWQAGERVDGHFYPFAQRVGPVWLVAVNSATVNRWAWDASGGVGRDQLGRLRELLQGLDGSPRIMVTHYPVCLANGRFERRSHGLRDLLEVIEVAHEGKIGLWLHGHRHDAYQFERTTVTEFPVICAGSSTQNGLWSYGEYTITENRLQALRRVFDPLAGQFRDGMVFALTLPS